VISELKFAGDFAGFIKYLNTDEKFFHKSPEALLAGYRDIAKRIDAEMPALLAELPRAAYGIKAMPAHMGPDRAEYYGGPRSTEPVPASSSPTPPAGARSRYGRWKRWSPTRPHRGTTRRQRVLSNC
jgi:hypothetical protein